MITYYFFFRRSVSALCVSLHLISSIGQQCDGANGVYYQNTRKIKVPSSCQNVRPDSLSMSNCPALRRKALTFIESTCKVAVPSICQAAYERNPPYSCSKVLGYAPLSIVSQVVANTGAAKQMLAAGVAMALTLGMPNADGRSVCMANIQAVLNDGDDA